MLNYIIKTPALRWNREFNLLLLQTEFIINFKLFTVKIVKFFIRKFIIWNITLLHNITNLNNFYIQRFFQMFFHLVLNFFLLPFKIIFKFFKFLIIRIKHTFFVSWYYSQETRSCQCVCFRNFFIQFTLIFMSFL